MAQKTLLFDLDGTLTDSGPGINNCAEVTLAHFGLPIPLKEELRVFVGPPLRDTFFNFGVPADRLEEAVAVYRKRYFTLGKFENTPYPGIEPLLQALQAAGHRLFVATSKPEGLSVEILEHFGLAKYFECICGSVMDGTRDNKADVIAYLLGKAGNVTDPVMIGDTVFDVAGAKAHNIPCVGVTWGYGKAEDLLAAGAASLAHTPEELLEILAKAFKPEPALKGGF